MHDEQCNLLRMHAIQKVDLMYAAQYCEENIYHLARRIDGSVVFITNSNRTVPFFQSKKGTTVVWDYHVILVTTSGIYDYDSLVPFPCSAELYCRDVLRTWQELSNEFERRYIVIPGAEYITQFGSDRRHMLRADGTYHAPVPPWPEIQGDLTLESILAQPGIDEASFVAFLSLQAVAA